MIKIEDNMTQTYKTRSSRYKLSQLLKEVKEGKIKFLDKNKDNLGKWLDLHEVMMAGLPLPTIVVGKFLSDEDHEPQKYILQNGDVLEWLLSDVYQQAHLIIEDKDCYSDLSMRSFYKNTPDDEKVYFPLKVVFSSVDMLRWQREEFQSHNYNDCKNYPKLIICENIVQIMRDTEVNVVNLHKSKFSDLKDAKETKKKLEKYF